MLNPYNLDGKNLDRIVQSLEERRNNELKKMLDEITKKFNFYFIRDNFSRVDTTYLCIILNLAERERQKIISNLLYAFDIRGALERTADSERFIKNLKQQILECKIKCEQDESSKRWEVYLICGNQKGSIGTSSYPNISDICEFANLIYRTLILTSVIEKLILGTKSNRK